MNTIKLKIITPQKLVIDEEANSVTVPGADGDITVLPKHVHLLTLLKEGIIAMKHGDKEDFLAIGGGYLETNGKEANILVSRAYKQDEIDEKLTGEAIENARKMLTQVKTDEERQEIMAVLQRSTINMKLLKRKRSKGVTS